MAKPTFKPNPRVEAIFDDLQQFLEFCQSYAWQQFNKWHQGKNAKNMWSEDGENGCLIRYEISRPNLSTVI